MGKLSRTKGHAFERDIAGRLRPTYGEGVKRAIQTRGAKSEGCDVEGTPWWIETKVGVQPNPRAALRQAQSDTDGRPVVCVIKDNGAGSRPANEFVCMPWSVFLAICEGDLP